jgi:hypothetical protein
MNEHILDSLITGYEDLIPAIEDMLNTFEEQGLKQSVARLRPQITSL